MRAGVRPGLQILWVCLGGPVGSIPTHFRHRPRTHGLALVMAKKRKIKPLIAAKEVKRLARNILGMPPPSRAEASRKKAPPKHKKQAIDQIMD
jgi:hypothetical protein